MVQRLNVILTTSPELSDFRKRLRGIESRVRVSLRLPTRIVCLRLHTFFRTVKLSLPSCIDHGVTIRWQYSLSAY